MTGASSGTVIESGDPLVSAGAVLHFNRGQHAMVSPGLWFVHNTDFFAQIDAGGIFPLPDRTGNDSGIDRIQLNFVELKGYDDEGASMLSPLHHFVISPAKMEKHGNIAVPDTNSRYRPRDNFGGDLRPMSGTVLAVPSEPIGRDGLPFHGSIPAVGDTVWFSTLGWSGGTSSSKGFEMDGGLMHRWPGLMPMIDMHLGVRPNGEMYGIGDYGVAMKESRDDGVAAGLDVIGSARFLHGGPGWESVHGAIPEGSRIWFRITQGVNGRNTVAPAPWGWCVRVMAHNLTGIGGVS